MYEDGAKLAKLADAKGFTLEASDWWCILDWGKAAKLEVECAEDDKGPMGNMYGVAVVDTVKSDALAETAEDRTVPDLIVVLVTQLFVSWPSDESSWLCNVVNGHTGICPVWLFTV